MSLVIVACLIVALGFLIICSVVLFFFFFFSGVIVFSIIFPFVVVPVFCVVFSFYCIFHSLRHLFFLFYVLLLLVNQVGPPRGRSVAASDVYNSQAKGTLPHPEPTRLPITEAHIVDVVRSGTGWKASSTPVASLRARAPPFPRTTPAA